MKKVLFETVIGLEIHIQSKTKSKMFCSCNAEYFEAEPNSHTCPTCLGLPGALPVPNKKAIDLCIKTALSLNCRINKETKFDRKNYFYPDLPKGFQISQYDKPIGIDGVLEVETEEGFKAIRITRVHQEEDTGKSTHTNGLTYLDYNKSGVPLIEIVTEPDFRNKQEVTSFAKSLKQLVKYLNVSDANMEKGQMRFELNISLRKIGEKNLPSYKVEVKNIGSISVLEKVIDFEIMRQESILTSGSIPTQETRGLRDMTGETYSQREKESESDYRYFPEPDIPLISISDDHIESIRKEIPELPYSKKARYIKDYHLDKKIAQILSSKPGIYLEFEQLIANSSTKIVPEIAKLYTGEYFAIQKTNKRHKEFKLEWLIDLCQLIIDGRLTRSTVKDVLLKSYLNGTSPIETVEKEDLGIVTDSEVLEQIINEVIINNPKVIEDLNKNSNAIMFLVGQVMRQMKGQADPNIIQKLIKTKLGINTK